MRLAKSAERQGPALAGRVALITGAGSGIGRELALRLAAPEKGCAVALVARTGRDLVALAEEIGRQGGETLVLPADVGDPDQAARVVEEAAAHLGRLDLLVNGAGVSHPAPIEHLEPEALREMVLTNFLGLIACTRAAIPHLLQTRGQIVNLASSAGLIGTPGMSVYSATKWGIVGFSESLRAELRHRGVRVTTVYPTYVVNTRMLSHEQARGPLIGYSPSATTTPGEVAAAVLRAIERGEEHVIVAPWHFRLGISLAPLLPGLRAAVLAHLYARAQRAWRPAT